MEQFGPSYSNIENKKGEDFTFGIEGVWIDSSDPKGTVRVGNIKIDEFYGDEDLERLREGVSNGFNEIGQEIHSAGAEYLEFVSIIEKLLQARKEKAEEDNQNK